MNEEPVPRTRKIFHRTVKFDAAEEDKIVHESLYWIYQFVDITCPVKFVKKSITDIFKRINALLWNIKKQNKKSSSYR